MRWHETEIIAGDININIIDHNRIKTHNYITVLEKYSFISLINIPSTEKSCTQTSSLGTGSICQTKYIRVLNIWLRDKDYFILLLSTFITMIIFIYKIILSRQKYFLIYNYKLNAIIWRSYWILNNELNQYNRSHIYHHSSDNCHKIKLNNSTTLAKELSPKNNRKSKESPSNQIDIIVLLYVHLI